MALIDNRLLYDIAIRLQVFAEAVKVTEARQWDALLIAVENEFRMLLSRIKFNTLDSLTKLELNKLVVSLRETQSKLYSVHLNRVLKRLEAFMQASLKVKRISYAWALLALEADDDNIELPTDDEASDIIEKENKNNAFIFLFGLAAAKKGSDSLWPKILTEPMPSNGALVKPFLNSLSASAQLNLENTLRKGFANNFTSQETMAEAEAVLNKVKNQATSVGNTIMQHIASVVSASITSGLFGKYKWLSVIDGATTEICRSRNGKIYVYGKGPIPPAHIGCRSSIMPLRGDNSPEPETFFTWVKRQPKDIQNIALGNRTADLLRADKLAAKDINKLTNPKSMTIEDYANSAAKIVGKV